MSNQVYLIKTETKVKIAKPCKLLSQDKKQNKTEI